MKMPISRGIDRPFPSIPVCDRYLAIGSIEDARSRICRMIDRCEGLGVIIGPPGTGKTLLCQRIASQYRDSHAIVMLGDIRVSSRMGLIQQVLFHLRISHQGLDEQEMQLALVESLTKNGDGVRSLLLIIDEAQMLSVELLDEIRMLTNLIRDGRQIVQTILVGGPKLEDPLADPQMESLSQRIVARCYLHAMTHSETGQYLRSMLVATGTMINDDAVGSVYHACGGVPRLINQLMNRALDFASLQRKSTIDEMCIQHAWADLQQLPSPVLDPKLKPRASEIEFGELDSDEISEREPVRSRASCGDCDTCETELCGSQSDEVVTFDFEPQSTSVSASYFDMEAILASNSIDCLQNQTSPIDGGDPANDHLTGDFVKRPLSASVPVVLKTTNTTIIPPATKAERKRQRDELFGIDFSDETLVDVRLIDEPAMPSSSISKISMPRGMDPAAEENSLHREILQMSRTAKDAGGGIARANLPWAPANIVDDVAATWPAESADVAGPMAVVWRDDEPVEVALDDRDILIIEDDVTVMVDPPTAGVIGSGGMRQPVQKVDQQYQNLFSRLRGKTS